MTKSLNLLLAVGALALASCSTIKPPAATVAPGKTTIANLSPRTLTQTTRTEYLLFLPRGYDARGTNRWPVIVFLHGAGERGADAWSTTVHGPTKYIEKHPEFPFILVSPVCPQGHKWSDEVVLGALDEVTANYAVDTNRIYLTGLSMGGYETWSLATMFPERFAAVAPICGGEGNIGIVLSGSERVKVTALRRLPVWAFHGGKDTTVAWEESDRMIKALQKLGAKDVKLTLYPDLPHNSWTITYDNPELYEWFLKHE